MALTRTASASHPAKQVWLVVLCFVFAAFAPTLTHALSYAHPTLPLEICTSEVSAPISQPPSPQDEGGAMQASHCPFCLQVTDRGTPPPQPLPYHFLVQGGTQVPMVWQAFFFSDRLQWAVSPRGPPLVGTLPRS